MDVALRVLATVLFWSAGIFGLFNYGKLMEEIRSVGLPWARGLGAGVIAVQLLGSALVIGNPAGLAWLGAAMLAGFTLLTIPYGHAFWTFEQPRRTEEMHIVLEHLTVAGALLLIGVHASS